jgi:uncharacterized protein YdeI (YjbR/CyaY-like superfamily)
VPSKQPRPKFFATPAAFRAWLEEHHATARELLVGLYKKSSGKPSITWPESVDEALCFGFERRALPAELAPEQQRLLRANAKASAFFDSQPPWYRRAAIHWVTSAKREETQARRLAELIRDSAAGRLVKPLRRPARRSPARTR